MIGKRLSPNGLINLNANSYEASRSSPVARRRRFDQRSARRVGEHVVMQGGGRP
jgi:hypothetical protein